MKKAKSPANDGKPEEELKEKNDAEEFENSEDDGTPFGWRDSEISKDCSWNEFQKATYGSQKNKAEAYYKHTGRNEKISARAEYMGATPQKDSPTGREVIKEMYKKNPSLFSFPPEEEEEEEYKKYLEDELYKYKPLPKGFLKKVLLNNIPLSEYDMGHKIDAVIKWNDLFSKLGEEEGKELARKWMKDPNNYELQLKSDNRSAGAKTGHTENGRYKPPETDVSKIEAANEEYKNEIDSIISQNENANKERKEIEKKIREERKREKKKKKG